ncbi:MAG: NAD(P)/FAD-dependent oxidoreductase [Synechococcaceae cyanobacterium]|nr:NAD(P)/FAD-dependent oxidoreductase [Synechococcaceae cyanobacterium]
MASSAPHRCAGPRPAAAADRGAAAGRGNGDALIVGGGIAGLATAISLTRLGWRCTILERDPGRRHMGHGLLLPAAGRSSLERLTHTGIEAASAPVESFVLHRRNGSPLRRYAIPGSLGLLRRDLVALLRSALPASVRVETGRVVRLEPAGAGRFQAVGSLGWRRRADLIVAADGVHSACRRSLFPQARLTPERVTELVLSLVDPVLAQELAGSCRKYQDPASGLALGLLPCRSGRLVAYAQFATGRHPAPEQNREVVPFLRRHFGGWNPLVERLLAGLTPETSHLWHTTDLDPLPHLHQGNVVLVGDSAHPLLPFTSQGSAAALGDALCLAAALDGADGRSAPELGGALAAYSGRRRRELLPLLQEGRRLRHHFLDPEAAGSPMAPLAGFAPGLESLP